MKLALISILSTVLLCTSALLLITLPATASSTPFDSSSRSTPLWHYRGQLFPDPARHVASFDGVGGVYDQFGSHWDAQGRSYDSKGGFWDLQNRYWDSEGRYRDGSGGFWTLQGEYWDEFGAHWNAQGEYTDPQGRKYGRWSPPPPVPMRGRESYGQGYGRSDHQYGSVDRSAAYGEYALPWYGQQQGGSPTTQGYRRRQQGYPTDPIPSGPRDRTASSRSSRFSASTSTPLKVQFPQTNPADRADQAALIYSDIKLDDLVGIATMHKLGMYSRFVVVIESVYDAATAERALYHFMDEAFPEGDGPELYVLYGTTAPPSRTGHEGPWANLDLARFGLTKENGYTSERLDALLRDKRVDVFQVAPISDADLAVLLGSQVELALVHVTHGFNTTAPGREGDGQAKYIETLQSKLAARARRSNGLGIPLVVVTDRDPNLWSGDGSTFPLSKLDGRIPSSHLYNALLDDFPERQMDNANELLEKFRDVPELKKVKLFDKLPKRLVRRINALGYRIRTPMQLIAFSRVNWKRGSSEAPLAEQVRSHFLQEVDRVNSMIDVLKQRRSDPNFAAEIEPMMARINKVGWRFEKEKGGVPNTFRGDSQIEVYDMMHMFAAILARDQGKLRDFVVERQKDRVPRLKPVEASELGQVEPHGKMVAGSIDEEQLQDVFLKLWRGDYGEVGRVAKEVLSRRG